MKVLTVGLLPPSEVGKGHCMYIMGDNIGRRSSKRINIAFVDVLIREAPQLAALLKEMKDGLDIVRSKVDALTAKVSKH